MAESKKGFDLSAVLRDVSNLDTGNSNKEQIEYIDIDLIDADPANFYELSGIDELAANIEMFGLMDPLRVRLNPDAPGHFVVVSGHRRRAAIRKLVDSGRTDFSKVACIRDSGEGSAALKELRLIFANSDTRKMSSADVSKQAERVEALLYQLKEEGYDFPGRMRDHVAEACKVSKSKLARLKVIRDDLDHVWQESYQNGKIAESAAYALAQIPAEHQQVIFDGLVKKNGEIGYLWESMVKTYADRLAEIDKLTCEIENHRKCTNAGNKKGHAVHLDSYSYCSCGDCCDTCPNLARCKDACPKLADKIKKLKADEKKQAKQNRLAQEKLNLPRVNKIQALWKRFGVARRQANKSIESTCNAIGTYYSKSDDRAFDDLERGKTKVTPNTYLPYRHLYLYQIETLTKAADLFGCSVDYLLCRTDDPHGGQRTPATETSNYDNLRWLPVQGLPDHPLLAAAKFAVGTGDRASNLTVIARYDGKKWAFPSSRQHLSIDAECVGWLPLPPDDEEDAKC